MLPVYLSFAALNCVVTVLTGLCSDCAWTGRAVFDISAVSFYPLSVSLNG